jgi:hypothetical protein
MCLLAFARNISDDFPFVLVHNRDEDFVRGSGSFPRLCEAILPARERMSDDVSLLFTVRFVRAGPRLTPFIRLLMIYTVELTVCMAGRGWGSIAGLVNVIPCVHRLCLECSGTTVVWQACWLP